MSAQRAVRADRHTLALTVWLALAGSAPVLAQTRLYLLTGGDQDDQCSASNCDPGRLIQIDVDRVQIASTRSSTRALEESARV